MFSMVLYHLYKSVSGFIAPSQTIPLNTHDNPNSFQLLHVERLEHGGSLVSVSSDSVRPGVFCQDAQSIILPHPRKCDVARTI